MNTDMKKQTALQWLYAKLDQMSTRDEVCDLVYELEEEAKAMERKQIVDAFYAEAKSTSILNGEQYYNETYGGDK
jgi:hypothetical protein